MTHYPRQQAGRVLSFSEGQASSSEWRTSCWRCRSTGTAAQGGRAAFLSGDIPNHHSTLSRWPCLYTRGLPALTILCRCVRFTGSSVRPPPPAPRRLRAERSPQAGPRRPPLRRCAATPQGPGGRGALCRTAWRRCGGGRVPQQCRGCAVRSERSQVRGTRGARARQRPRLRRSPWEAAARAFWRPNRPGKVPRAFRTTCRCRSREAAGGTGPPLRSTPRQGGRRPPPSVRALAASAVPGAPVEPIHLPLGAEGSPGSGDGAAG